MLVDKPAGVTSHDVVRHVRRVYRTRAVGHTGTLDPFATGLLVLLLGRATRLARFVEGQRKTYLATAHLGWATDTDDLTGAPVEPAVDATGTAPEVVTRALAALVGAQQQRPPAYSAKHVAGERAYALARRGETVALAEVPVTVYAVEPVEVRPPLVRFRATVSPGTYIRALARDLGERLGTGGHLTALRRESIGALRVEDAVTLQGLDAAPPLLPPRAVLGGLPHVALDAEGRSHVVHGRPVPADETLRGTVALVHGDELAAVGVAEQGRVRPTVVLAQP